MTISFLICPNGYGHLFRSIELINFFLKKKNNLNINLLCSNNHFSKVSKEKILNKKVNIFPIIPNYDLRTNTYDKLLKLYNFKISKKIIDNTDIFISDNLINKYLPKDITFLHSNFFWGDVYRYKTNLNKYRTLEKSFLKHNTCRLISNRYFGINKKKLSIRKFKIGFTGNKKSKKINLSKKYLKKKILVYFSGSDVIPHKFINKLINNGYEIYSNNINLLKNKRILNFNYKENNMENFSYLITKPGLGSLKDSIRFKIFPIFYFKGNNFEYLENFKKIKITKKLFNNNHTNQNKLLKIFDKITFQTYRSTLSGLEKYKFDGNKIFWNLLKKYEKK